MNIQIDAKGKQCPLPVIEAKNAISGMTEAGIVEVTVDNEIAVQNLTKMADHKGLKAKSEKKSNQEYTVWMEVTEEFVKNNIKDGNVSSTLVTEENCIPDIRKKKTVVVLGADHMGEGDEKLGKMLMKGFVYALTQLEELPQTILLFNSGAYLSCEGSDSVEDLKSMEAQGVEVKRGVDTYWMSEPLRIDRKTGGWFCDQYVCDRADNDGSRSHCKTIKDKENEKKYHYRPRRRGYRHGHNL